jgi:hypothetical protein
MSKILRLETLFGTVTEVLDASHLTKERKTQQEIKIFQLDQVLEKNSVFLGFGKPNVFLGIPYKESYVKFDAKSLKRKKSEITDTKGWAQSGLIFLFKNASNEMIEKLNISSKSFVGSKYWTCVNANCRVLNRAGITSGGKDLSEFYFPMPLARHIIKNGLEYNGEKIEISIIKTMPNYLESFGVSVVKSQLSTFYRHGKRYFKNLSKKYTIWNKLNKIKHFLFDKFKTKEKCNIIEDVVTLFPENIKSTTKFNMTISKPSRIGLYGRFIWGPHVFFEIKQDEDQINQLLPNKLKEYEAKKNSLFNSLKKNVLFSKPVINFIRNNLIHEKEIITNCTEKELYNMIRTDTDNRPHKYNLVITNNTISVIKIGIKYKAIDWILSKHVLLSGYSNEVRFAGEFWKEEDGCIYFNNNSGTYAPNKKTVDNAETLLQNIFPNVIIVSVPFV